VEAICIVSSPSNVPMMRLRTSLTPDPGTQLTVVAFCPVQPAPGVTPAESVMTYAPAVLATVTWLISVPAPSCTVSVAPLAGSGTTAALEADAVAGTDAKPTTVRTSATPRAE
jgi:hypothetical protein